MFKINMVNIARRHLRERRAKRGRREDVEEGDGDRDGDRDRLIFRKQEKARTKIRRCEMNRETQKIQKFLFTQGF